MADDNAKDKYKAAEDALLDAIATLAKRAKDETGATYALKYAAAASQLAEARAWVLSADQAHGGFSVGD